MKSNGNNESGKNSYDIAVRQFRQHILPGGLWNRINGRNDAFPPTKVWGYGPAIDPKPDVAPSPASQFNYPAYTVETTSGIPVNVRWINDLVNKDGEFLPHFLPVDQTVHWANPKQKCDTGMMGTDCEGTSQRPYKGPVPIVVHVHGAHVDPHSDGYPEAWWLPAATNIPATYATEGSLFDDANGQPRGRNSGYADYFYRNDQPATTLWYHDHTLGMTRLNVYAGPAGYWLIRGGVNGDSFVDDGTTATENDGILPGPAPVSGDTLLELNAPGLIPGTTDKRSGIREIPILIQDRSFNDDGSLFYPKSRAFFEGVRRDQLRIPLAPYSDVLPIWNPEAFFNTIVVNGTTWPFLNVEPDRYRLRLLNGCNSRFLNLSLIAYDGAGNVLGEIPFYQIGAEEGFLQQVVEIKTGFATLLSGNGTKPASDADRTPAAHQQQALLMGLAERADVIMDFTALPAGTARVRMLNTASDEPFGGFPVVPSDPGTTGQVMEFVLVSDTPAGNNSTPSENLVLPAADPLGPATAVRGVSLNERESLTVCVLADAVSGAYLIPIKKVDCAIVPPAGTIAVHFAPAEAQLGMVDLTGPTPLNYPLDWGDTHSPNFPLVFNLQNGGTPTVYLTENPQIVGGIAPIEEWQIFNFTEDAHPIHLHMVRFQVVGRQAMDGGPSIVGNAPQPTESGYKDTVITYPGEITTVRARFDLPGLYVWHCHILEHEDNEMMRPYIVTEEP
ncbi:MAG: copper oxidase [Nitrospirae bacterium]|nr:copper oxidase [Nitrospirota bacterium]